MLLTKKQFYNRDASVTAKCKRGAIYQKYCNDANVLSELSGSYLKKFKLLTERIEHYAGYDYIFNYLVSVRDSVLPLAEMENAYLYNRIKEKSEITFTFKQWCSFSDVTFIKLARANARMDEALHFIEYLEKNNLSLRSK